MDEIEFFNTQAERWRAQAQLVFVDHGFLRTIWRHEFRLAPGVWRSNQPSPRRIAGLGARGFKSVITLRGEKNGLLMHRLEEEACHRHGLKLFRHVVGGGTLAPIDRIIALLDCFKKAPKPFVIHCKSGIDRTGLASFLYLVAETGTPPVVARRQLSFQYLHLRTSRHGILDHFADSFLNEHAAHGVSLRAWLKQTYDPVALTAEYHARQGA